MPASWSSFCSSSLPKYGMYGLISHGQRVGGAAVGAHGDPARVPPSSSAVVPVVPVVGPVVVRPGRVAGHDGAVAGQAAPPWTRRPARTRGASRCSATSRESPADTSSPTARRNATSSLRLRKTRTKEGSTRATRNRTPMTTVRAWVTSSTVGPWSPRAATTTWTSSPATAMASRRIRVAAMGGSPRPGHEEADDHVAEEEAEGDDEGDPVGEEVRRRRGRPATGR